MSPALMCRGVVKRYGATTALAGVDLSIEPGEIRGLVGRNGAGKSTLLRCALGLVRPDHGTIKVLDRPELPRAGRSMDGVAGVVDGTRWPRRMTVERTLRMLADYDGCQPAQVDHVMDRLSLTELRKRRVDALSLGGRQRLGVAAALLRSPRLLLLDEPVNGLDPAGRRDLRQLLMEYAANGAAVLVASHDLPEIQLTCHTVTRLDHGRSVGTATVADLAEESHQVRVQTTDDAAAIEALGAIDGLHIDADSGRVLLEGPVSALQQASIAVGRAGIAILRWEPVDSLAAIAPADHPAEAGP